MDNAGSMVSSRKDGFYRHHLIRSLLEKELTVSSIAKRRIVTEDGELKKAIFDLLDGYEEHCLAGKYVHKKYMLMRALYIHTRGSVCKILSDILREVFPPQPIDLSGTLFQDSVGNIDTIVGALHRDGVYVFPKPLSPSFVSSLRDQLMLCDALDEYGKYIGDPYAGGTQFRRIFADEKGLVSIPEMVQIATDPLILSIAQAHFGCQPILNTLASYKTHPEPPGGFVRDADAAQAYHFDFHTFNWLKLFVCVHDVDEGTGPHHFVRTSHHDRPASLWREGRIPDSEIEAHYSRDLIETVCGPAGTAFIADTSAFHKGSLPTRFTRVLAQFEYCNTLFGPDHRIEFEQRHRGAPLLESALRHGPRVAQRFLMRYL